MKMLRTLAQGPTILSLLAYCGAFSFEEIRRRGHQYKKLEGVLRQNLIWRSPKKSLLQLLGKSLTKNINPIRQYNQMVVCQASPAQASQSLGQHSAIAVSVKQRRARTDGAAHRLPGFE
jgi:hypothetical protein